MPSDGSIDVIHKLLKVAILAVLYEFSDPFFVRWIFDLNKCTKGVWAPPRMTILACSLNHCDNQGGNQ
jgi:hypothetical protein